MKANTVASILLLVVMCASLGEALGPLRGLLQVSAPPSFSLCDGSVAVNFYLAPGFGCFLDAPACSNTWWISDNSKVNAIQNSQTKAVSHIRCTWSAATVAQLSPETQQLLATKTDWGCYYASLGLTYDGPLAGAAVFQGTGKVDILGNGDLTMRCNVNPGTDKHLGNAQQVFGAIIGCLHGDSIVDTPTGPRKVQDLDVGDKVLAQDPVTGALVYDDVIFRPHKNAASLTRYQDIKVSVPSTQESRRLQVTTTHYVPVEDGGKSFKLAKDVQVGDIISVVVNNNTATAVVESSTAVPLKGYYGVWTGTGTIVVDGVLATAHAEWPAVDTLLNKLPGNIVDKHHMLQAPMRMLYKTAGATATASLSNLVNAVGDARPIAVGGAVAAYALAGAKSDASVKA